MSTPLTTDTPFFQESYHDVGKTKPSKNSIVFKLTAPLAIICILLGSIYTVPMLFCEPMPLYDSQFSNGVPPLPRIGDIAAQTKYFALSATSSVAGAIPSSIVSTLPGVVSEFLRNAAEPPAELDDGNQALTPEEHKLKRVCEDSRRVYMFPLPHCGPFCSTAYYVQTHVTNTAKMLVAAGKAGLDMVGLEIPSIDISSSPPWAVFRFGQPFISVLHNLIQTFLPAERKLLLSATAFMRTAALRAAVKLHIADHIYKLEKTRGAGVDIKTLSKHTCTSEVHLERLLRALVVEGIFADVGGHPGGMWTLTAMSDLLREDHPESFKAAAAMMGGEQYVALGSLYMSVQTGDPAFNRIYGDFWQYHDNAQKDWKQYKDDPTFNAYPKNCAFPAPIPALPEGALPYHMSGNAPQLNNVGQPRMFSSSEFNQGMTAIAGAAAGIVSRDGPFGAFDTVVDIAGGRGHQLGEILRRHPSVSTGILFDLKSVYDDVEADTAVKSLMSRVLATRQGYLEELKTNKPIQHKQSFCRLMQCPATKGHMVFSNHAHGTQGAAPTCQVNTGDVSLSGYPINYIPNDTPDLCPTVSVQTGSFFEVDTIPKAHDHALPALVDQIQRKVQQLSNGDARGITLTKVNGKNALSVTHRAAYVMMQILHDWSDKDSITILKNLHTAMKPPTTPFTAQQLCCSCGQSDCTKIQIPACKAGETNKAVGCPQVKVNYESRIYIADRILTNNGNIIDTQGGNYVDLLMMNNFDNAKERTIENMKEILEAAGYKLLRILPTRTMYSIVEAEPIY